MLSVERVRRVEACLAAGASHREASRQSGVSRGSIATIASGAWWQTYHRRREAQGARSAIPTGTGERRRCETCGAAVFGPCVACAVRRSGPAARCRGVVGAFASLGVELESPGELARYAAVRDRKQLGRHDGSPTITEAELWFVAEEEEGVEC